MIKFIKELFTKNLIWKLFSLSIAIVLWIIVINIKNPVETKEFSAYVTILGEESLADNNLVLSNKAELESKKVTIKVRGGRLSVNKLRANEKNIVATINLKSDMLYTMNVGKASSVYLNIKLPTGSEDIEIIERSEQYLDVFLEKIETIQKTVDVIVAGTPKDGFLAGNVEYSPKQIQIKGASSLINKVNKVIVSTNIDKASSDIVVSMEARVYDVDTNEIVGLDLSDKYIKVSIPIDESKKVLLDGSSNQGILQDGYTVTSIDWEPKYIEVVGNSEAVNNIEKLVLPPINLSGLNATKEVTYNIEEILPQNVQLREGSEKTAKVTITIEKLDQRPITIPIENLTVTGFMSSNKQYKIEQDDVTITVQAISSVIDKIDVKDIKLSIDISKYDDGTYSVPINVELPSNLTLSSDIPTLNVLISSGTKNIEQSS